MQLNFISQVPINNKQIFEEMILNYLLDELTLEYSKNKKLIDSFDDKLHAEFVELTNYSTIDIVRYSLLHAELFSASNYSFFVNFPKAFIENTFVRISDVIDFINYGNLNVRGLKLIKTIADNTLKNLHIIINKYLREA